MIQEANQHPHDLYTARPSVHGWIARCLLTALVVAGPAFAQSAGGLEATNAFPVGSIGTTQTRAMTVIPGTQLPATVESAFLWIYGWGHAPSDPACTGWYSVIANLQLVHVSTGATYATSILLLNAYPLGTFIDVTSTFSGLPGAGPWNVSVTYQALGGPFPGTSCTPTTASFLTQLLLPSTPRGEPPVAASYGGPFRRVDLHGIPMPERSPTADPESDRKPSSVYVDMFNLQPHLSGSDVRIPMEGGDLQLEFRRTAAVSSYRQADDPDDRAITFPSDRILGPGWHTNLGSRITVTPARQTLIATVIDDVGAFYSYVDDLSVGSSSPFPPDTAFSMNAEAQAARLYREDAETLVLQKTYGTTLRFAHVAHVLPPDPTSPDYQDYYRLESVEDRNGNRQIWRYLSDDVQTREAFLVSEIFEEAHPERRITFGYSLGSGGNGGDWGDRLVTVTDPLGRVTTYTYGDNGGQAGDFLVSITREAVLDGESNVDFPSLATPVVQFTYEVQDLPAEPTTDPTNPPAQTPGIHNRFVALETIQDARGHLTTLQYASGYFPASVGISIAESKYTKRLHLTGLSTADGQVSFERLTTTHEQVTTRVTDTRMNATTYDFMGQLSNASNLLGKSLNITSLARTGPAGTVQYTWSDDVHANLTRVVDVNGNEVAFSYDTPDSRKTNQPTSETRTDTVTGESITTMYEYGVFARLSRMVDGEGKVTSHVLDPVTGNRDEIQRELGSTTFYGYESDGFVSSMTDPDGRLTQYVRSFAPGNLARYYAITEIVRGHGDVSLRTVRVYDVMGNLVEMRDPRDKPYSYDYDALYRQIARTAPVVGTATTTYTLNGSPVKETDFAGNVVVREYDSLERITAETRRATSSGDLVTRYTYNPAGLVEVRTDPEGNRFRSVYDATLRLVESWSDIDVLNYVERYAYGANAGSAAFSYTDGWQPTEVTDRRGFVTRTTYDGFYRPVEVVELGGSFAPTTRLTYNKVHNEVSRTVLAEPGGGGDRTTYTLYDDLHRVVGTAVDADGDGGPYGPGGFIGSLDDFMGDPDDQITLYRLDLNGNRVQVIDPLGNVTTTIFDGANRAIEVREPAVAAGVPVTLYEYDASGNVVLQTDPRGTKTLYVYDDKNREIARVIDLDGDDDFDMTYGGLDLFTATGYDDMDNVISRTDARGNTTTFLLDSAYRRTHRIEPPVTDAENGGAWVQPVWGTAYDRNGNVISEVDPRGVERRMTYDGLDRLEAETVAYGMPEAMATTYEYDANDNVVARVLDNGAAGLQRTEFGYDAYDRQISETWPGGRVTTQTYFGNGLLDTTTDPKGQRIERRHDRLGRLVQQTHRRSDSSVEEARSFTYDLVGNLLVAVDRHGASTSVYDALYRVISESRSHVDSVTSRDLGYTLQRDYDVVGNPIRTVYPLGVSGTGKRLRSAETTPRIVRRVFDRANRLVSVMDTGTRSGTGDDLRTQFVYDPDGNLVSRTMPNGVIEVSTYDALSRRLTMVASRGGSLVYQATYGFDVAGNRRSVQEEVQGQPARAVTYGYDGQYRLIRETDSGVATQYTYDLAGNRKTENGPGGLTTYQYNARNELQSVTTGTVVETRGYDLNGNLAQRQRPGATTQYRWDVSNRLVGAERSGSPIFAAEYDFRSRRLVKREAAGSLFYVHSEGLTLREIDLDAPRHETDYVHGLDMGGGVGAVLYSIEPPTGGSATRPHAFFSSNHIGHTVALTDLSGAVTHTELFEAFGGSRSTTGSSNNTRRAYTKERDDSLGFDCHGFRYYEPATGRYVSRDPAGYPDGLDVYVHASNNPVNRFDPRGLDDLDASVMMGLEIGFGGSGTTFGFQVGGALKGEHGQLNVDYSWRELRGTGFGLPGRRPGYATNETLSVMGTLGSGAALETRIPTIGSNRSTLTGNTFEDSITYGWSWNSHSLVGDTRLGTIGGRIGGTTLYTGNDSIKLGGGGTDFGHTGFGLTEHIGDDLTRYLGAHETFTGRGSGMHLGFDRNDKSAYPRLNWYANQSPDQLDLNRTLNTRQFTDANGQIRFDMRWNSTADVQDFIHDWQGIGRFEMPYTGSVLERDDRR